MKILLVFAVFVAVFDLASAKAAPPQLTVSFSLNLRLLSRNKNSSYITTFFSIVQVGISGGTDGAIDLKPAIKWVSDTDVAGVNVEVRLVGG